MHEVLAYQKQTDKKYRWDAQVGDAPFEIYIPKWRVPEPCPATVTVRVYELHEYRRPLTSIRRSQALATPKLLRAPVVAELAFTEGKTRTVRYDPVVGDDLREIGSPYIPYALLPGPPPQKLVVVVKWGET